MKTRINAIVIALMILITLKAHGEVQIRVIDQDQNPVANAVVWLADSAVAQAATTVEIDQMNKAFVPEVAVVKAGQQVRFPNSDDIRHHIYSFSQPNAFEVKLYGSNEEKTQVFQYPGVAVLGCNIHDQMRAFVHIIDQGAAWVTDAQGWVRFEGEFPPEVQVWHARLSTSQTRYLRFSPTVTENDVGEIRLDLLPEQTSSSKSWFKSKYRQ
ncbi:MAG: methylamine utilization protein [Oleiphilaceae bacterium]|nr:methylamine utilization protein [Oleiphilaceae bacterium]